MMLPLIQVINFSHYFDELLFPGSNDEKRKKTHLQLEILMRQGKKNVEETKKKNVSLRVSFAVKKIRLGTNHTRIYS